MQYNINKTVYFVWGYFTKEDKNPLLIFYPDEILSPVKYH